MSIYEDRTYENLMDEALDRVSSAYDKRPGSMVWNGNAPCLAELAQLYIALDFVFQATFVATAPREYLIKRAADRSITPYPATRAILRAEMNRAVPVGTRFSVEDLNFVVIEQRGDDAESESFVHLVECETAGTVANAYIGRMIPIDYVDGLTRAETVDIYAAGTDEEDTETFRARVIEALRSVAFGGNVADYKAKAMLFTDVGQVKVLPIWNGPGTVKLILMSANVDDPALSQERLDDIQNEIDPPEHAGTGLGLAPIGHTVTVTSVRQSTVDVTVTVVLHDLDAYGDQTVAAMIHPQIEAYFKALCENWEHEVLTVRTSFIQHYILSAHGGVIDDILSVKLNGAAQNVVLDADAVPALGTVTVLSAS